MNYGLYISAAGMRAQDARQTVIANNIANANTTGFKRDLVVMQARANAVDEDPTMAQYRLPVVSQQGGGVNAFSGGIDLSQGRFESTDSDTQVALNGPGFFTVQTASGEKLLTRDGNFHINQEGKLAMYNGGSLVLDQNGQPIQLNSSYKTAITSEGEVRQSNSVGGSGVKLGIVDVKDSHQLIKRGANLLQARSPEALAPATAQTTVIQHHLEESGVDPILEMVNMMTGMRAFEANAKMITYADTSMAQLNTVGRVA